jgi:hypothetical protein
VHGKAAPFQLAQAAQAAAEMSRKPLVIIWCGYFHDDFQRRVFMDTAKSMAPQVPFHHVDGREADARFSIWAAADIFCSLSDNIQESFGLTVIEAMAAELPVVVSNWNGYRAAVEHGKNGIMIDSYMPQASLAETAYRYISGVDTYDLYIAAVSQLCFVDVGEAARWLARLAGDEALRNALAAAARKTVETWFDWAMLMPRYADLWREQIERVTHARERAEGSSKTCSIHDPANTFAGYPSHRLTGDTRLDRGPHFERWNELVQLPGIVVNASALTGDTQYRAIQKIFAEDDSQTIDTVLTRFADTDKPAVLRTLHWLIKVGLLRMAAR